jgi:hypothetical protein
MKNQQDKINKFDEHLVKQVLVQCWSKQSSSSWIENNPARGQCSVTAIVIQERFGGEILKTNVDGQWHFYNVIDGIKYDLTIDQFEEPPNYIDIPSTLEEGLSDTNQDKYNYLLDKFQQVFSKYVIK